ncbi:MAG: GNAT family N-acetyltransferase [Gammaproteobacteria bacterium]|nr:GNAT family N-acetyltransferase [Gammaproteobacteria bacterium]MBV9620344.1 GNAT family N-acetyltransferase [Gammaproteobacteria bacterium]
MEVRAATAEDMVAVGQLSRELARYVQDPDPGTDIAGLRDGLASPERWGDCLVAVSGGHVVGFATYCRIFEAHTREKRLWLGDLCVQADSRRQGVGRALVTALRDVALSLGCVGLTLELARGNIMGRRFYERIGARAADDVQVLRISCPP